MRVDRAISISTDVQEHALQELLPAVITSMRKHYADTGQWKDRETERPSIEILTSLADEMVEEVSKSRERIKGMLEAHSATADTYNQIVHELRHNLLLSVMSLFHHVCIEAGLRPSPPMIDADFANRVREDTHNLIHQIAGTALSRIE